MLLSICIPTRNESSLLKGLLDSLVVQKRFNAHTDIQIVISDNASSDQTESLSKQYVSKFPETVKYYRHQTEIESDLKFEECLRLGDGDYLKLINTRTVWTENSIEELAELISVAKSEKPLVFLLNGLRQTQDDISIVRSADDLIGLISYYSTWIGGLGLWKEQFDAMSDFSRCAQKNLVQTDVLLRLFEGNRLAIISNSHFCNVLETVPKGTIDYNLAEVFGRNYIQILRDSNLISEEAIEVAKKEVLLNHIIPFYLNEYHNFGDIDLVAELPEFAQNPALLYAMQEAMKYKHESQPEINSENLSEVWRERNSHNETVMATYFDPDIVRVGNYSYGPIQVLSWGNQKEKLEIGHFVSISGGVTFILGGNHPYQGVMTFPVKVKFLGFKKEAETKGAIVIKDDVWIGFGASVLSGVTVGQGAIIAAHAVVAKDVPPYSIVAGNPARIVKFRFDDATIQKLLKIDYSQVDKKLIRSLGLALYEPLGTAAFDKNITRLLSATGNQ
jgi:acetyltransferase-like isoleucine patch superfamily enzyme/glycosyltransferase involved in cell wall biosynthesis